jgi:predicted SprT family Zn-dependent metalloprotease
MACSKKLEFVSHLAETLLRVHGLWGAWKFEYDNGKTRYGCCQYNTRTISVSRFVVRSEESSIRMIRNIILHEIAHALVGYDEGHGPRWRECAKRIGCDGERCNRKRLTLPGEKRLRCPCGLNRIRRFRITKKLMNNVCVKCRKKLYETN